MYLLMLGFSQEQCFASCLLMAFVVLSAAATLRKDSVATTRSRQLRKMRWSEAHHNVGQRSIGGPFPAIVVSHEAIYIELVVGFETS